jgi:hypothetical protein
MIYLIGISLEIRAFSSFRNRAILVIHFSGKTEDMNEVHMSKISTLSGIYQVSPHTVKQASAFHMSSKARVREIELGVLPVEADVGMNATVYGVLYHANCV